MATSGDDNGAGAEIAVPALLASIRRAFHDVPYPGDDGIVKMHFQSWGGECFECAEVRDTLAGKDWSAYFDKPFELFGYFGPDPDLWLGRSFISLLQVEAIHYFLPVILAALITDPGEADMMVYSITGPFAPGRREGDASGKTEHWQWRYDRCTRLLALMDAPQRLATAAALRFIFRDEDFGVRPSPFDAVANLEAGQVLARTIG